MSEEDLLAEAMADGSVEELIQELLRDNKEKDDKISELTSQLSGKGRRNMRQENIEDEIAQERLNEDNRMAIENLNKEKKELLKQVGDLNNTIKTLKDERVESDSKFKSLQKQYDELQRENRDLMNKNKYSDFQNQEINKQKSLNIKISQQLTEEVTMLNDTVSSLRLELIQANKDKIALQEAISKIADERETFEANKNEHTVEKDNLKQNIIDLEDDLLDLSEKLVQSTQAEAAWEKKYLDISNSLNIAQNRFLEENSQLKQTISNLEKEIYILKDTTQSGQLQKEYDELSEKFLENKKLFDNLQFALEESISDRNVLANKVIDYEDNIEQIIEERIHAENIRTKKLESEVKNLQQRILDEGDYHQSLESQVKNLINEVDELSNWKAVYEAGHGLQHISRNQKKLSDDNRRLTLALEQRTDQISVLMDANNILSISFEKLKKECGKSEDFFYPELQLHEEVQSITISLQLQVKEFQLQIDSLENENTRLRKALRDQVWAGNSTFSSEEGFKFSGFTPDLLVKVNEFALNLKDGKLELPVDDRSRQLLKDVKTLREENSALRSRITNGDSGPIPTGHAGEVISDTLGYNINKLVDRSNEMQENINTIMEQINKASAGAPIFSGGGNVVKLEDLTVILSKNNEMVLEELELLRRNFTPSENFSNQPPKAPKILNSGMKPSNRHLETPLKAISYTNTNSFNYWTPFKNQPGSAQVHGSVPHGAQYTGGYSQTATGPMTPHGKQLANNTIMNMNLPPEEWTSDVKDLNLYLIEILEQLYEREYELNSSNSLLKQYEDNLAELKLQLIIMYHDYNNKLNEWNESKTSYINENKALIEERNDMKLRLNRLQDMINVLQAENDSSKSVSLESKLNELTRKIIMYEVNESILSRKYISLEENLKQEIYKKNDIIKDYVEMESTLKQRILFLETHKLTLTDRFNFIQKKLDHSVPQEDYLVLYNEIENLREELLNTLKREVNIRSQALTNLNSTEELKSLRYIHLQVQTDLEKVKAQSVQHQAELLHSNELVQRGLQAANVSKELSDLVSEMAKYRGETTRLEVELNASNRRYELLNENYLKLVSEHNQVSKKLQDYELNESDLENKNLNLRNENMNLKLLYENGLTKDQKDHLTSRIDFLEKELQVTKIELNRQTELSEIASNQAQTLTEFKNGYLEEIKELKEYCSKLESRSEDEVLIGRLQRQLMSMKASYKIFVRKYQGTRENLRRREIALRIIEKKLIDTESKLLTDIEVKYVENNALKRTLRELKHTIVQVASGESNLSKDALSIEAQLVEAPVQYTKYLTLGMGKSILDISTRVNELSAAAESSLFKFSDKEEENRKLQEEIEKLNIDRLNYSQRLQDISALNSDDFNKIKAKGAPNQNSSVALRLISLSEELRINKLSNIQNKRQISTMRDEIKHLKINLAKTEHDLLELEKQKIEDEFSYKNNSNLSGTAGSSGVGVGGNPSHLGEEENIDIIPDDYFNEIMLSKHNLNPNSQVLVPLIELPEDTIHNDKSDEISELKKRISEESLSNKRLETRIDELKSYVEEKENQLNFYERVLMEENLQHILLRMKKGGYAVPNVDLRNSYSNPKLANLSKVMQEEQDRIQEIATITINNLKSMLDEKNILIDRYRDKIDRLIDHVKLNKSYADKRAEELLNINTGVNDQYRLDFLIPALTQLSTGNYNSDNMQLPGQIVGELQERCRNLQSQLDNYQSSLGDKERTVDALEKKLSSMTNQCERAELRCESSLREMEAMKEDMMTLVQQLSESENRCSNLTQLYQKIQQQYEDYKKSSQHMNSSVSKKKMDTSIIIEEKIPDLTPKVKELEKTVKNQNDKIKGYREIIVRLKDEFMRVEEQQAEQEAELKALSNEPQLSSAEIIEIKDRVATLQEGIRNAKIDLEKARKNRDKVLSEKEKLADEIETIKGQLKKTESQLTMSQNFANKLKNDLEESRKKESRLRAKLKDMNTPKDETAAKKPSTLTKTSGPTSSRIDELQRENELLRAQNAALMKNGKLPEGPRGRSGSPDRNTIEMEENIKERDYMKISIRNVPKGPYILGMDGTGGIDEVRQDYHKKWEAGKNLQKRVNTLEERVQELIRENDTLTSRLQQSESNKNSRGPGSPTRGTTTLKKTTTAGGFNNSPFDFAELENSRAKIFKLEEQVQEYKRKVDVEQSNQIRTLKQNLSSAQGRIIELERELAEYEERRKKHASDRSSMREEEEKFLREEKLRDEVIFLRRNRLELEADALEKENRSIELQFEIEASAIEKERLRRRVNELESFAKHAQNTAGSFTGPSHNPNETLSNLHQKLWGGDTQRGTGQVLGGNNSTKKELELEGVVEAMKRVVEKLRLENERLKRGIGINDNETSTATPTTGKKNIVDYEKRFSNEKKKNEKLEEEISNLQNQLRSKNLDDNNLNAKLALKQQQVNSLKKQIKTKEEELSSESMSKNQLEKENDKLSNQLSALQDEVSNLESQLLKLKKNSSNYGGETNEEEFYRLQAENKDLKQKLVQLRQQKLSSVHSDDDDERELSGGQLKSLNNEVKKLRDENSRLKEELSAFDLEFFEEIENLKFNYTQALKKIQQYEVLLSGSDLR